MARRRKKTRTHVVPDEDGTAQTPKSVIVRSGRVNASVTGLIRDLRRLMEPNTASRLRERRNAKVKDYVHVAAQLGVTHCVALAQNDTAVQLRVGRLPRGPTLTFAVDAFSLCKDVRALQRRPKTLSARLFDSAPLLVLNNFERDDARRPQLQLVATMFQNLLPAVDVASIRLAHARRVVLVDYCADGDYFDLRHYSISVRLAGVSRSVQRLIRTSVPNLHACQDISEYILRDAATTASESEVDDAADVTVAYEAAAGAAQPSSSSSSAPSQRAIRLVEIGPRLRLGLQQVHSGLFGQDGTVLYARGA